MAENSNISSSLKMNFCIFITKKLILTVISHALLNYHHYSFAATTENAATIPEDSRLNVCATEIRQMPKLQQLQRTIKAWKEMLAAENYAVNVAPNFPDETIVRYSCAKHIFLFIAAQTFHV